MEENKDICLTSHVVIIGIYKYLPSLSIPYYLCPQQVPQLVVVL